ncbi:hypothetical protein PG994_006244 [Apiospora phragmitis]|uniref:Uncharacterized protein n=1 Tax=Apiospora phragmitis TaxID=2905665 RepID=A0ABR1VEH0_9PEZI
MEQEYDLLILTGATPSMHQYLPALRQALTKIISVSCLTDAFSRIGIMAYRDCEQVLTEWSGWHNCHDDNKKGGDVTREDLIAFAKGLSLGGGLESDEWVKTGAAHAYSVMRPEAITLIVLYADAPPHMIWHDGSNVPLEQQNLKGEAFGVGNYFADWVSACRTLSGKTHAPKYEEPADERISKYMPATSHPGYMVASSGNIDLVDVKDRPMKQLIQPRATPISDLSKRYTQNRGYAKLVVKHLRKIVDEDITSITVNPVFGGLWHAVCNDPDNPSRNQLLGRFIAGIQGIINKDDKERAAAWLDESYSFSVEIEEIIREVAEEDRFPCVFLDPKQVWTAGTDQTDHGDHDSDVEMATLTRADLLEIGRSCHPKVLRRLGRVLTRLSYVTSADEMPEHIRTMPESELIRIPLALAKDRHQRVFWKALLHLVVPGTKLSGRPACVLATLSIRMGIMPLLGVADQEMLSWKDYWNNLEGPETWNTDCMSLLLDANADFAERHRKREPANSAYPTLLKTPDRELFERLVDYSLLKFNMDSSLTARVGWHPDKSRAPVGPLVLCKECHFPRSVTIMAPGGICGLCLSPDADYTRRPKPEVLLLSVSQEDGPSTASTWVVCCNIGCLAQYVVYDSEGLRVRAKCHFCRRGKKSERAPTVECNKCLSRIIWPDEYRAEDMEIETYECPACVGGYKTIVEAETTPRLLCDENGMS